MTSTATKQPRRVAQRVATAPPASPIVKWAGGKSRLLPELLARVPRAYTRYFEPLAGGAALFFRLAPRRAVLADSNPDLIGFYRAVASSPAAVLRRLELHRQAHAHDAEGHYYDVRARWNDRGITWSAADRAAAFKYLNATCFNGLWRVNRGGVFNVPIGRYVEPAICSPVAMRRAGELLARAELVAGDYRTTVAAARRGDLVDFDPPYVPTSATSVTSYTAAAFGPQQQHELAETARELAARGVAVMVSNHDTRLARRLYKGFTIARVKVARSINSDAGGRGVVSELIATAGY